MELTLLAVKNVSLLIPVSLMFIVLLCSPAIQINLSTKKNKYLGLIFPAIVFIIFIIFSILAKPPIVISILMIIGAPAALIAFHFIIRKNLRY